MSIKKIYPSSTLIIISSLGKVVNGFDYKVTLLKRNDRMRVLPEFHVFPGGKLDDTIDKSLHWLKVFFQSKQEINKDLLVKTFKGIIHPNSISFKFPHTLTESGHSNDSISLPPEITYRLCAIRETFEETGILLAFNKNKKSCDNTPTITSSVYNSELNSALDKWRIKIQNDSSQFINMFLDLNLIPDIMSLHEWSNWLTPINEKVRFNTFFFICFLKDCPKQNSLSINKDEIESLEVSCKYIPIKF
jgi:nucleoside diphosphate-linked moiety X motif 19, mitochondrial